ncbi:T9SS type A sorting domain-containing protein [Flavivirga amylovorans]|uniref:T9SS type A sorting domain-containing protein n=1 Tax=Flavivirga amylovorans TaxID=870486 RepID=A0ABT8X0F4_9FLAO|nr:T9SS type A sorting domain-containing protein [Flavivirga amylovorans]MDO5987085.1 T9SS type A sorting domain-containing protein [Flavivirga amylovorans]
MKKKGLFLIFGFVTCFLFAQNESKIVFQTNNGCLQYVTDDEGNYIPDYSYAGYKYGEEPPDVSVSMTISPVSGDNTTHIQNALDAMAALPLNSNGFRGTLLLQAGTYPVSGIVTVRESGIVLRGVGQDSDPSTNTIIESTSTNSSTIPIRGGYTSSVNDSWTTRITGTTTKVTSSFIPAGSRTIALEDVSLYQVGDNIVITHPSTNAWLSSIDNGATASDAPWVTGELDMFFNRIITGINVAESKIILDVPVYDHLDLSLSQSEVYKYDRSKIKSNIGIENLRVDIRTTGEFDEAHAITAIRFQGVEDSWIRDVTALHFAYAGMDIRTANRVSIIGCSAIEPHSVVEGGKRYNFAAAQLTNNILFKDCFGNNGRHTFVSNGRNEASGIVFYNCSSDNDLATTEGHRRWTQGMLFDNITFTNPQVNRVLGLYNRGDFGTGHGWSTTHSTAWNITMPVDKGYIIQKPPGRQNYAIGCKGNPNISAPFTQPKGYVELENQTPLISSLYEAQLNFRLNKVLPPDAPSKLQVAFLNGNANIEWLDIAADETGYIIEFKTKASDDFSQLIALNANETVFTHDLTNTSADRVWYRVMATGVECLSPFSNVVEVSLDNDNDGIPNSFDQCPNTPNGATVDVNGCEIFSLPADNFSIKAIGESCVNSNNGTITISSATNLNYTATISLSGNLLDTQNFNNNTVFDGLIAGTYTVCITLESEPTFKRCSTLLIGEPEPLSVFSKINAKEKSVTLQLEGAETYIIELNSSIYTTSKPEIKLPLNNEKTLLQVKTNLDCQGIYEENIILGSDFTVYPNPVKNNTLNVLIRNLDDLKPVELRLFDINGTLIYKNSKALNDGKLSIDFSGLSKGVYLFRINTKTGIFNQMIIK